MLSDKEKRAAYDRHGEEGVNKMAGGGGGHDPFSSFFGDFFGGGGQADRDEQMPRVSFETYFSILSSFLEILEFHSWDKSEYWEVESV